jgi:inward rectifier potassium channel
MFSNTVVTRSSYTFKEIVVGAKFNLMYHRNEEANKTVLNLEKINSFVPAELNGNIISLDKTVNS